MAERRSGSTSERAQPRAWLAASLLLAAAAGPAVAEEPGFQIQVSAWRSAATAAAECPRKDGAGLEFAVVERQDDAGTWHLCRSRGAYTRGEAAELLARYRASVDPQAMLVPSIVPGLLPGPGASAAPARPRAAEQRRARAVEPAAAAASATPAPDVPPELRAEFEAFLAARERAGADGELIARFEAFLREREAAARLARDLPATAGVSGSSTP